MWAHVPRGAHIFVVQLPCPWCVSTETLSSLEAHACRHGGKWAPAIHMSAGGRSLCTVRVDTKRPMARAAASAHRPSTGGESRSPCQSGRKRHTHQAHARLARRPSDGVDAALVAEILVH